MDVRLLLMALTLAVTLALAGCVADDPVEEVPPAGDASDDGAGMNVTLPDPIAESGDMTASLGILSVVDGAVCPPLAQCQSYPFTLNGTGNVAASLSWGVPVNDFDLYIVAADGNVTASINQPPGTEEQATVALGAGDHMVVVVGFLVVTDTFALDVTFS